MLMFIISGAVFETKTPDNFWDKVNVSVTEFLFLRSRKQFQLSHDRSKGLEEGEVYRKIPKVASRTEGIAFNSIQSSLGQLQTSVELRWAPAVTWRSFVTLACLCLCSTFKLWREKQNKKKSEGSDWTSLDQLPTPG